jgi:hypothetical protein
MAVKVYAGKKEQWIRPTEKWQNLQAGNSFDGKTFSADKNFYITLKKVQ